MKWIGFVASRYISRGRKRSPASVFSILGIATGVLALIVIIAVMNGFQLGFIESILEISSGHLRIENFPADGAGDGLVRQIRSLPSVASANLFREANGLIRGRFVSSRGVLLRGVLPDILLHDPGLDEKLDIEDGAFDLSSPGSIVLGAELARHLAVRPGDKVTILSFTEGPLLKNLSEEEGSFQYTVAGIFRCGFYEYDLGWAYLPADSPAFGGMKTVLGVKLKNRWRDREAINEIKALLGNFPGLKVVSWREYNRAFFGALRTEKLMMFILVGLIFIVVGLNIYQSQRRAVLERREEIGLLKALGSSDLAVRLVFVWDGLIIGALGAGIGLAFGLLIAFHIPGVFSFIESLVNFFISLVNEAAGLFGVSGGAGEFAVFSPQVFYIKEIPSRVIPSEVFLIFLFGFLSALVAAWIASFKTSRTKPAEVLRYDL